MFAFKQLKFYPIPIPTGRGFFQRAWREGSAARGIMEPPRCSPAISSTSVQFREMRFRALAVEVIATSFAASEKALPHATSPCRFGRAVHAPRGERCIKYETNF
jgi:hypothetical protein